MEEMALKNRISELERENRILKQRLLRSEENRRLLEETLETNSNALKVRNNELEESRELIKQSEARYRKMALHDTLTELPNRTFFYIQLEKTLSQSESKNTSVALLFLDLDLFKHVNDDLGHEAGDRVLLETARRLLGCVRKNDIVVRLGGDEFAILLPELNDIGIAERIAKRIIETISQPLMVFGNICTIGVSIGISLFPEDTREYDKLLQFADIAMYSVKRKNNNSYRFYHELH